MCTMIEFHHVSKDYDGQHVLSDINLTIEEGKFYTLLGPSGCGKTTILRLLAGFSEVTRGEIILSGQKINDVPANKRPINTVFQDYALFPHMTVFENVAFGLKMKKWDKKHIEKKVTEALALVQLSGFEHRHIHEMSGGQRQRVAIARALVNEPKVLLLDEALSALDQKLRTAMQSELRQLQKKLGITFIFVTHDQEEALAMSDEIFILNEGHIVQSGTPVDIYDEPINRFVAEFIGESNIIDGIMRDDYKVELLGKVFDCVDGGMKKNESVEVVIRPEDLVVVSPNEGKINVTVESSLFRGVHYELNCVDDDHNHWMVHTTKKVLPHTKIGLFFAPEDIHVMRFNESEEEFDERLEHYTE